MKVFDISYVFEITKRMKAIEWFIGGTSYSAAQLLLVLTKGSTSNMVVMILFLNLITI